MKKNKRALQESPLLNGAPGGTRTHNLLIRSQMLYPIKLRALQEQLYTFSNKLQALFHKKIKKDKSDSK